MKLSEDAVYLGDGLYAWFEHGKFVLWAPRGDGNHWVALEPEVLQAFLAFVIEKQGKKDLRNEAV